MATFESIFPTFLAKCAELHDLLLLVAYALFVVGIIMFVAHGFRHQAFLRLLLRLAVLTALLVFLPDWGNRLQDVLNQSVLSGLGVDPTNVDAQYKQLLETKNAEPNTPDSWFSILGHWYEFAIEKLIYGILWLIGFFAAFLQWWAYVFQKIILHMGYALSPILIGFMAIHALKSVGARYLMNLVGVLLWPLGWAVAALVTQAVLDFMTDPSFKFVDPTGTAYALQNAVGLALLGFWIIFSTFATPIIIHKVLVAGTLAGGELLSGTINTMIHTATTTAAAGGVALAAGRPAVTAAASAATAGTLAILSTSAGLPSAGAFILAGSPAPLSRLRGREDITGDLAVRQLIARSRNRMSEPAYPPPLPARPLAPQTSRTSS